MHFRLMVCPDNIVFLQSCLCDLLVACQVWLFAFQMILVNVIHYCPSGCNFTKNSLCEWSRENCQDIRCSKWPFNFTGYIYLHFWSVISLHCQEPLMIACFFLKRWTDELINLHWKYDLCSWFFLLSFVTTVWSISNAQHSCWRECIKDPLFSCFCFPFNKFLRYSCLCNYFFNWVKKVWNGLSEVKISRIFIFIL